MGLLLNGNLYLGKGGKNEKKKPFNFIVDGLSSNPVNPASFLRGQIKNESLHLELADLRHAHS
jgi:hypothetical protein